MATLSVVCPNCRSRLSIKDAPGIQDKMLSCPICQYKAKVSLYQLGQAGKGGQKPVGGESGDTIIPHYNTDMGQMRVVQNSQIFELKMGSQVMGRLANSGKADLQIGVDKNTDPYMSRRSVQIEVVKNERKGILHKLVCMKTPNPILLNGNKVNEGDQVWLKFGDKLTLGKTDVVLEETNNEGTQVL